MEDLIRALNSPQNQSNPKAIHDIQRQLQHLQREQSAWQISLRFLDAEDFLLQFYGALTLGQKVNADWDKDRIGTDREQVQQLLERLVTIYVKLSKDARADVVLTKLSSVLAAVFAKPGTAWAHPARHVLTCILSDTYVPEHESPSIGETLVSAKTVTGTCWNAVLRLACALQEESRSSNHDHIGHRFEIQLANNVNDVWQLISHSVLSFFIYTQKAAISDSDRLQILADRSLYEKILGEALQQVPAWAKHITSDDIDTFELFRSTASFLFQLLNDTTLAEYCMPCIAALQASHPRLTKSAIPDYITKVNTSNSAQQLLDNMLSGYFSAEATTYVEFLEAVVSQVDFTSDHFLTDPDIVVVLEKVQRLTGCQGAAMVEDEICQTILEIMTTVAEGYNDWPGTSSFDDSMITLIKDVCLTTLVKVQYPPTELDKLTTSWGKDEFTRFDDFRFQAKDFFETAFGIIGPALAEDIAKAVTLSSSLSWSEFEAGLFVLTSVADALSNEPEKCDPSLSVIFGSELWTKAISGEFETPSRVRRAVIRLLAESTSYLQRNPQFMISSLDFLFRSLHVKALANQASGAIHNLCDNQRGFLVQALPQFLDTMTTLTDIPLHARGKVLSGVSALIQALPTEQDRIAPLRRMLELIESTSTTAINASISDNDELPSPTFERITMLAAVARGLQSPADTPIDLEAPSTNPNTFWISGPGASTQQAILDMLVEPWTHIFEPGSTDLVSICCELLRAGFKETHPSPFKFSPTMEADLICTIIDLRNPNLDQTMATASCFVSAAPPPMPGSLTNIEKVLGAVIAIATQATTILGQPVQPQNFDPPTSICDFTNRCLLKYGQVILANPSALDVISPIFDFTMLLLKSTTDTLPRRTVATFFTSFLELTAPGTTIVADTATHASLDLLYDKYLPAVLGMTMHFLAGECARSEIEAFSNLLRTSVSKQQMRTRKIIQEAIQPESGVLTEKALIATKPEQRARFLAQVEGLRGAKKTNDIVRDFWISCKGGQFGYVT